MRTNAKESFFKVVKMLSLRAERMPVFENGPWVFGRLQFPTPTFRIPRSQFQIPSFRIRVSKSEFPNPSFRIRPESRNGAARFHKFHSHHCPAVHTGILRSAIVACALQKRLHHVSSKAKGVPLTFSIWCMRISPSSASTSTGTSEHGHWPGGARL